MVQQAWDKFTFNSIISKFKQECLFTCWWQNIHSHLPFLQNRIESLNSLNWKWINPTLQYSLVLLLIPVGRTDLMLFLVSYSSVLLSKLSNFLIAFQYTFWSHSSGSSDVIVVMAVISLSPGPPWRDGWKGRSRPTRSCGTCRWSRAPWRWRPQG